MHACTPSSMHQGVTLFLAISASLVVHICTGRVLLVIEMVLCTPKSNYCIIKAMNLYHTYLIKPSKLRVYPCHNYRHILVTELPMA